jgi:hypothetical protein
MPDSIVLEPICLRYGGAEPEGLDELQRQLAAQSSLPPVSLRRAEDAMLSPEGLVQRQYRFTHRGLSRMCTRLVQGLSGPMARIAGLLGQDNIPPRPALAIRIINGIIREYFDERLRDCRFIVDPTRNAIEGVVSSRYEYLSNSDWLTNCQDFAISCAGSDMEFLSATLAGRGMLLRFVDNRDWITVRTPDGAQDTYRRGWSFSNSETGDSAVRVGMLIVDEAGNSAFRMMGRCEHTKRLRETKGMDLLNRLRVSCEKINRAAFQRNLLGLHHKLLPEVDSIQDLTRVSGSVSSRLSRRLPKSIARAVTNQALSSSLYNMSAVAPALPLAFSPFAHSYYHLYHALTAHARACFPREQENTELLAYDLLRGRLVLSE